MAAGRESGQNCSCAPVIPQYLGRHVPVRANEQRSQRRLIRTQTETSTRFIKNITLTHSLTHSRHSRSPLSVQILTVWPAVAWWLLIRAPEAILVGTHTSYWCVRKASGQHGSLAPEEPLKFTWRHIQTFIKASFTMDLWKCSTLSKLIEDSSWWNFARKLTKSQLVVQHKQTVRQTSVICSCHGKIFLNLMAKMLKQKLL